MHPSMHKTEQTPTLFASMSLRTALKLLSILLVSTSVSLALYVRVKSEDSVAFHKAAKNQISGRAAAHGANVPVPLNVPFASYAPNVFNDPDVSVTHHVDNTNGHIILNAGNVDTGQISLRSAIIAANNNAGADTIMLGTGTYTLSIPGTGEVAQPGDPNIGDVDVLTSGLTITGNGAANTIIQQTSGVDRIIDVNPPFLVGNFFFTIDGVTITGGRSKSGDAGGLFSGSNDTGLATRGKITIKNCVFKNNTVTNPGFGGGAVQNFGGDLEIDNCIFGGPLASDGNSASTSGGAVAVLGANTSATVTIKNSTFTNNTSASGGSGGGALDLANVNLGSATATITNCTFTGNSATPGNGGAIIDESMATTISNSSFNNNSAGNRGGGIYVGGASLHLDGTNPGITFTGNTASIAASSSMSTSGAVTVSGTNVSIGGSIEITTNGSWTNNPGSTLAPTDVAVIGGTLNMCSDHPGLPGPNNTCLNGSTMNVGGNFTLQSAAVVGGEFNGGSGTLNVAGNFSYIVGAATPAFNANTSTFNFNGTGAQSISNNGSIAFNNLTVSNVNQPLTVNNSLGVNGTLNVNGANATLAPVAATIISGSGTLTGTGTARVTRTAATAGFSNQYLITNKTLTNLTVDYFGSAAQVLSSITYGPLKITNAAGVNSAAGTATVNGLLTLTTGTLNVGTSTLIINNGTSVGTGTLASNATGTVNYNQGSIGQNVLAGSYGNLIFSNFNKVLAGIGTIGVAGVFTPGTAVGHTIAGSTINFNGTGAQTIPAFNYFNLSTSGAHTTNNITLVNSGTIGIAGAFSPLATFSGGGGYVITNSTVDYNGSGAQMIAAFNYNNLTSSNVGTRILQNGGTVGIAGVFTVGGNSYTVTNSTVNFNAAGAQTIPAFNYNNLTISGTRGNNNITLVNGGTIGIAGAFNPTATFVGLGGFVTTNNTVDYNGTGAQTIAAFNYNNLTLSGARGANNVTLINGGTIGIGGVFNPTATFAGGNYVVTNNTVNFNGAGAQTIAAFNYNNLTSSSTGARTLANTGSIGIAGVFTPGTNAYTITGSTVVYNGSSPQTLPATFTTYNNLTLNNAAGTTGFAGLIVQGLLRVQAGTFTSSSTYNNVQIDAGATLAGVNATTINVGGNWTNNGTFTANNNTVNFNGSAAQVIGGSAATTFQNLTIANAGSGISLGQNATVNGVLTLTNDITTGANILTMPATGTSLGTADVIGNVRRSGFTGGGAALSFGNPFNSIAFAVGGTLPTNVTINLVKAAPGGGTPFPTAVLRTYTITPTGGSGFSATLRLHYLDAELNSNAEAGLGLWRLGAGWSRQGSSAADTTNNWVQLAAVTQFSPWTLSSAKNDTTTTITQDSPDPSTPGASFDVFFTVAANIAGGVTPTGNVVVTVSGGAETCTGTVAAGKCTLTLTNAGSNRTITATYNGDANSNGSSDTESHSVCGSTTVTSTSDSGAGSLRQIITGACDGATITFDSAGVFATPQTITLTNGEILIDKNLTINAGSSQVTISGNNASRVFNIAASQTFNLIGLTLSGGSSANDGGAIINNGTLTIVNSTLTGNAAANDGGAISSTASATSLTLVNTTISGNTAAGSGGGIIVLGGTATSTNNTITNNKADNDNNSLGDGGGIRVQAGTVTLQNTIVAGNFNEDGVTDAADDITGTVDASSSFNLIGTGGSGGLTNGVNNNQVGVANPGLGSIADNGGKTQTHALLAGSPAIEAGSNANLPTDTFDLDGDANTGEALPVDQRGTGFPRVADSADADLIQTVDIGAYEAHPTIEDIANQTTNEDTVKNVTFNIGDDTGALINTVTATSSNTTLVPNGNLSLTGSGGSRNLQITPAANQSGTTTITVTVTATNGRTATDTFDLTVNSVNDPPSGTDNAVTTNEDTAYTFGALDFGFTDPNDSPPNTLLAVKITTLPALGTLTNNNVLVNAGDFIPVANINGGLLKFTPAANGNGTPYTTFTFQVQDNGGGTDLDPTPNTMTINVTAVNDPPSFTIAADPPAVLQDAGPQTVINFATNTSPGPNEAGQVLTFNISPTGSTGTLTFLSAPAINATTGTLTYTANNGTSGTATFSVTLSDNGSNTPPNSNTSEPQSFTITVNPPNATPVVTTTAGNLAYTESDPATAIDPGLTVTDSDSTNLTGATITITAGFVSAQDTLAFTNQLGITGNYNSGSGVLTLSGTTTVANYQTALRTVTYQNSSDNPTASRTIQFSATDGFTIGSATRGITITAVNDGPVNTVPGPQSTNEDTAKVFSSGNANQISVADVDLNANPIKITLTATNGTVTLSTTAGLSFTTGDGTDDPVIVFTGALASINTALNGLAFNPTPNFSGAASLQIISDDQGFTGTGGPLTDTDSVNITVNAVNDAPVVTTIAGNLSYTENAAPTAIDPGLTVTDVDSANLTGATVAITGNFASGQDVLGFTNQLGISGNYNSGTGVLTLTGTTTVANYQTALRSVTYANSSDNPSTSTRTVTFTVNDGTDTGFATRGITVTAVNDPPVNTVPGGQGTPQNTPLVFNSGNSNQISVADVDAGGNTIQVTLTATNGTLTLSTTSGLSFAFSDANGTGAGDGTADATMTFRGMLTNVNAALSGMTFTPTNGFTGAATVTITSNDLGNTGSGGPLSDTDVVNIQVGISNITIQDAQLVEPSSGSANMIFTVTLSAAAPAGGLSVNFTTQDQAPALNHATSGQDYTATSGIVNFAQGEVFKTIQVPILADNNNSEGDETFLVLLSNPVNGTITDGTATGTILTTNQPGAILISELRTSGPAGDGDDFVEIYNNSNSPVTVAASDGSSGWGLFKMGATCSDTPVLIGTIPNGTILPARGHYLFVGSAYSLANYGGSGAAAGDQVMTQDIESDRNIGIFSTSALVAISSANRLDAVGFGSNTGGTCDLVREGTTLTPLSGSVLQYSYFRDECGKKGNPAIFGPCPTGGLLADTNVNSNDFIFADTVGTATPAGQLLGAPGPQNLASPRLNLNIAALLIDATKASTLAPNRVRDFTPVTNGSQGTLTIGRRFVNNTGAPVTRLRFRIVDFSSLAASPPAGLADLRAVDSLSVSVSGINDSATCAATGTPATAPCSVTVFGTTLEQPPTQSSGGALNSSLSAGTITLPTPLAPGQSINLQFRLGVQSTGSFKFFFNVEALP